MADVAASEGVGAAVSINAQLLKEDLAAREEAAVAARRREPPTTRRRAGARASPLARPNTRYPRSPTVKTRALICAALLLAACLTAQARDDKDKAKTAESDQTFVNKAVASDLAEINISRLAVKNSKDEGVKKFAQRMIDDHGKTSKELLDLVNKKSMKAPERMDAEHDRLAKKLTSLSGSEFDKAYVAGQVKDHEAAVALFESQSKDGKDDDLKAWAKKTLPHLREHLKMAKELNKKVGGSSDKKDGSSDKKDKDK